MLILLSFLFELLLNKVKVFLIPIEKVIHFSFALQNLHLQDVVHIYLRQPANRTAFLRTLFDHYLALRGWLKLRTFPFFLSHFLAFFLPLGEERSNVLGPFLFLQFATYFFEESFFCCLVEGLHWLIADKETILLRLLWGCTFGAHVYLAERIDLDYFRVVYAKLIDLKVNRDGIVLGLLDYYLFWLLLMLGLIFDHLYPFSFDQLPL